MADRVQSQKNAWAIYEALTADERVVFFEEPKTFETVFRELTHSDSPSHRQWSDAYLAAFAITAGFQVVTFDSDFRKIMRPQQLDLLS